MTQTSRHQSITIWRGFENRSCVSSIYNDQEFYYPAYRKAAQCINEIISAALPYIRSDTDDEGRRFRKTIPGAPEQTPEQELLSYPNNIVAFCAKRGQGKTSAMVSMAKALEKLNDDETKRSDIVKQFWSSVNHKGSDVHTTADQYKYSVTASIDPSTMEKNDSVMRNVLSRLFSEFCKTCKRKEQSQNRNGSKLQTDELLDAFTKCFQSLDELKLTAQPKRYDDLVRLSEVGDRVRMKRDFAELVRLFLKFEGTDMLVIQIDDADLNTAHAFEIAEDIRRYCVVPRVIVLMAMHLDTLRSCIERQNVKNYEYLLRSDLETEHMGRSQCHEMAERYIDKLIPGQHQVHLPYVEDVIRNGSAEPYLRYYYNWDKDKKDYLDYDPDQTEKDPDELTYQNRLFRLVYEKTGLILMPTRSFMHNFLPRRYRELTHFLAFFVNLEDVEPSGEGSISKLLELAYAERYPEEGYLTEDERTYREELLQKRIHNLEELETYFIKQWCAFNLSKSQIELIKEIMNAPLPIKHAKVLECIRRYKINCGEDELDQTFIETHFNKDDGQNPPKEVTYADVIDALNQLKSEQKYKNHYRFIYAIHLYYSIYMNQILFSRISQHKNLNDLISFCGKTLFPKEEIEKNENLAFQFDMDLFVQAKSEKNRTIDRMADSAWIRFLVNKEVVIDALNENAKKSDSEVPMAQFDLLHAVIALVEEFNNKLAEVMLEKKSDLKVFCTQLASALQLICNYDVQYRVRKYCLRGWANEKRPVGRYSDWAAALLYIMDTVIEGGTVIRNDNDKEKEKWLQLSLDYDMFQLFSDYEMPKQMLPITSCLYELINDINDNKDKKSELIHNALNTMYHCQPEQYKEYIGGIAREAVYQLEKAIEALPSSTMITNGKDSDWWVNTSDTLLKQLKKFVPDTGSTLFKKLFYIKGSAEETIVKTLRELYDYLREFENGQNERKGKDIKEDLSQYDRILNQALPAMTDGEDTQGQNNVSNEMETADEQGET